ncbi:MAG: HAD-IC family P-type ATPase, partial [Candidatus Hydrogenedentota bacterium]
MTDASFHSRKAKEVLEELKVDPERGLESQEVTNRQARWGKNELEQAKTKSAWTILLDQFKSLLVVILAGAAVLAFSSGRYAEGFAIVAVLVVNGGIGFVSEWRAVRSMEALRKLGKPTTRVLREGNADEVGVPELVPGDIVLVEGGDMAPADLRIVEANSLVVDESPLTGESVPVPKDEEPVDAETPLAKRSDMLFKGTTVVGGSGAGVVVATGMDTEIGNIAAMTAGAESEITPLEKRLNKLGTRLAILSVSLAVIIALIGVWVGQPAMVMVQTAIALAVAAIPEGLPIVATIALARGMWIMARKNAIINRLTAVETLGSADVIFTDKTGTLTENRMALRVIRTGLNEIEADSPEMWGDTLASGENEIVRRIMENGVLCNNASLSDEEGELLGDPTEVALLEAAQGAGMNRDELLKRLPEEREVSFDPDMMMMATYHREGDAYRVAVKGAPT